MRYFRKKKIFIQANCQSHVIRTIFQSVDKLKNKYEILDIKPVHLWKDEDKEYIFSNLDLADIFLHQPISEKTFGNYSSSNLIKSLSNNVEIVSFPNIYFTGYHPQAFYLKDKDGKRIDEPFSYHDRNIVEWYLGMEDKNIPYEIFLDKDYYTDEFLKMNLERSLLELKNREKSTDIKISDYVENNMFGKKLFHVFNHPNNEVLYEFFDRLLLILGEQRLSNSERKIFKNEFLGQVRYPVYKSVQKYFGINEEIKISYYGKDYDLNRFIKLYFDTYERIKPFGDSNGIPKTIVQYWNTINIPHEIKKLMATWKDNNYGFSHELFHREEAINFIETNYDKEISDIFKKLRIPAMQSDFFRVAYILKKGGIYIDAATFCKSKISSIFESNKELYLMRKWNGNIWNGFIAAHSGNKVLERIFKKIINNINKKDSNNIWLISGPGVFNDIIGELNGSELESIEIFDQQEFGKKYFDLVNDLEHKRNLHWSKLQKVQPLYEE